MDDLTEQLMRELERLQHDNLALKQKVLELSEDRKVVSLSSMRSALSDIGRNEEHDDIGSKVRNVTDLLIRYAHETGFC